MSSSETLSQPGPPIIHQNRSLIAAAITMDGAVPDDTARKPHWYSDGEVFVTVKKGRDGSETGREFRLHRTVLILSSGYFLDRLLQGDDGRSVTDSVTIHREDPDRFQLLLDWIYPHCVRRHDPQTLDVILELCDRYRCDGLCQSTRDLLTELPLSFDLLRIAFKHRLDTTSCCRLSAWAVQQPDFIWNPSVTECDIRCQIYLLKLAQLVAAQRDRKCPECAGVVLGIISDPDWNGDRIYCKYHQHTLRTVVLPKLRHLCPFRFERIFPSDPTGPRAPEFLHD